MTNPFQNGMALGSVRLTARQFTLLLAGVLTSLLWMLQVHPYLNVANDAGRYMTLGSSLAQRGDLRLINDLRQPLDTLYPPGFPLIIAFWLKITGRTPDSIVLLVKFSQLLFLLGCLPLLCTLLERIRLHTPYVYAGVLTAALCPALTTFANEVMSEIPFLFCCLAAIVLAERDLRKTEEEDIRPLWKRLLALLMAALAFLIRTAGIALLFALIVQAGIHLVKKRTAKEAGLLAVAICLSLLVVLGWNRRNTHIMRHAPPGVTYSTYRDQFSLRDPSDPKAGRIELTAGNLLERAKESLPIYVGMVPRSVLHTMSIGSVWLAVFYSIAIPFALLLLLGFGIATGRGWLLTGIFCAVFWVSAAMWPWRSPRFLVPLFPFFLAYVFLGAERVFERLEARFPRPGMAVKYLALGLFWVYFLHVQLLVIRSENRPTLPGYALGRTRDEAGFYAACQWLKENAEPNTVLMGRPAYILHLYTGHPTTQIEPHENPRVQEIQYVRKRQVRYLVQDVWSWSKTGRFLNPYLRDWGYKWKLAWEDPQGSKVRVWQRLEVPDRPETPPATP